VNGLFIKWSKRYLDRDYCVRMYSLNYDRIFRVLLQDENINIFEGYDLDVSNVDPGQFLIPNLKKIVTDFNCNVFYNLHGSAYWYFTKYNQNQLPGYQFYLEGTPELNNPRAIIEIERNKWVLISNIITGYQKVLKTALSPFRQMLSAFDRDCIEADKLFIVGYSYSDEHINDIIRNARKFNSKVEIVLINPSFDNGQFMFDFLLHWGSPAGMIYQNEGEHIITSRDFKVRIIQKTFAEFLANPE
jgi:SIR2-like domain